MPFKAMKHSHRQALQLIQQNDWDAAHRLVQDYSDPLSCQIHGYLHRIEGDLSNARNWYQHAELNMPDNSLEEELTLLLEKQTDTFG
jgi:Flp pilus assembly protein TadD